MKVYTLTLVRYDYDTFESLEDVGSDLQKLIDEREKECLPVLSYEDTFDHRNIPGDQEGDNHYYYQEWDV